MTADRKLATLTAGKLAEVSGGMAKTTRDLWTVSGLAIAAFAGMFGAKKWCNRQDRSGTLSGDAVCSGIYERRGKPGQNR